MNVGSAQDMSPMTIDFPQASRSVSVIGLGYVGLPLCLAFTGAGMRVVGVDTDPEKTEALARGESYIKHIPASAIAEAVASDLFTPTTTISKIRDVDAIVICVPTPLTPNRVPDLTYVESTARAIASHLRSGQLVVLESTTYPGTTDEVMREILEAGSGLVAGRDFHLAFSPEREDPGNPLGMRDIPKIVGGLTAGCQQRAVALYSAVVNTVVPVSSCRAAEATKLLENIFRAVNIALVNELKLIYSAMDVDIWEVVRAAATKPFGFMPFYPGPGLGGHCIPIDPFYLTWKAAEYGMKTRLIELAGEINTAMPQYVVSRIATALNDARKSVNGAQVLLLGLAYKPNVDDDRESPTYEIMRLLEDRGAVVSYNDPHIPMIRPGRSHHHVSGRQSVSVSPDFDVIVVCTNHREYQTLDFQKLGVPVVDCRDAIRLRPEAYYKS
jgi:UDP-N-acetyl-D-glucosamine dehydrogenase